MFEQHPVPQQISSYQFRLVGNMTIKQFFQIAAGAIVALIIYGLPLPGFLKWPFIIIAALGGAAFAFLPIQDRPLEQWLFAFTRSIYSPTYFVWKKPANPPQYFKQAHPDEVAKKQKKIKLTPVQEQIQDLQEAKIADKQKEPEKKEEVVPEFIAEEQAQQSTQQVQQSNQEPQVPAQQAETQEPVQVPQQSEVEVQNQGYVQPEPEASQATVVEETQVSAPLVENNLEENVPTQQAQFSSDAAPPRIPDLPNIIIGQVMDSAGHIIQGAILDIKDASGRPVRAIRSNNAGHFMIVTSLENGTYTITTDKEGYEFEPVSVEATGQIINPIAIRAKN